MMVLDADMIKELHKLTDKTISQIPLMATWLSSKDLQWPLLQKWMLSGRLYGKQHRAIVPKLYAARMLLL